MAESTKDNTANLDALNENIKRVDELTQRLVLALANRKSSRQELNAPDHQLFVKAASAYFSQMMSDPSRVIEQQVKHFKKSLEYWAEHRAALTGEESPVKKDKPNQDRRFKNELWEENPFFNMVKQQYLMSSEAIEESVAGLENMDEAEKKQVSFFAQQMVDMFSPTNFLSTNPDALTKALETNGESLVAGLENLVRDIEANQGETGVTLSDPAAFEVGNNIAFTPGEVVFQNRMFQLIQYAPTTEEVHEVPLLIVPPWINKFYILDLSDKNSFIKFALDEGFTVFVVSWVNPDASYRDVGFDTYVQEGLLEAVSTVKEITDEPKINVIGYCIGGTLLTTTLAYMAKKDDKSIKVATFFTTLTDFEDAGDLAVYIDNSFLDGIEKEVDEVGYLDSMYMSRAFSYLRSNDLVYGPAVKSYLMGEAPPAFDLLYWNGDSTHLPARMAKEYLRELYQENRLSNGKFRILDEELELQDIQTPIYVVAAKTDHIAPWKSSFKGLNFTKGEKTFVLAGSGHIAGIINPANSVKYGHWINEKEPEDLDVWLDEAISHEGSWWANWSTWLSSRSGNKIQARKSGKSKKFPALEPAPGSYVKKKAH